MCMRQRTNIEIDPRKLEKARKISGLTTAKAIVDFALDRLSRSTQALSSLMELSGRIHFKRGYSYKRAR